MIDDRRRMLRGIPVQNMNLKRVHFNSFVGFGGSDLGNNRQQQDINKHDDGDVTGGNDVGSCGDEEFG